MQGSLCHEKPMMVTVPSYKLGTRKQTWSANTLYSFTHYSLSNYKCLLSSSYKWVLGLGVGLYGIFSDLWKHRSYPVELPRLFFEVMRRLKGFTQANLNMTYTLSFQFLCSLHFIWDPLNPTIQESKAICVFKISLVYSLSFPETPALKNMIIIEQSCVQGLVGGERASHPLNSQPFALIKRTQRDARNFIHISYRGPKH